MRRLGTLLILGRGELGLSLDKEFKSWSYPWVDEVKVYSLREILQGGKEPAETWESFWEEESFRGSGAVIYTGGSLDLGRWDEIGDRAIYESFRENFHHPLMCLLTFTKKRMGKFVPPSTSFVFTNTQSTELGDDEASLYVSQKASLLAASRSLGRELWADARVAVVNVLLPIFRPSRMWSQRVRHIAELEGIPEEEAEARLIRTCRGVQNVREVASALLKVCLLPPPLIAGGTIDLRAGMKGGIR